MPTSHDQDWVCVDKLWYSKLTIGILCHGHTGMRGTISIPHNMTDVPGSVCLLVPVSNGSRIWIEYNLTVRVKSDRTLAGDTCMSPCDCACRIPSKKSPVLSCIPIHDQSSQSPQTIFFVKRSVYGIYTTVQALEMFDTLLMLSRLPIALFE
jgi:hypothetical protein